MGLGQEHTSTSAEMVRRNRERMSADTLAAVVAAFLDASTTANRERMKVALDGYREARCAA